MGGIVAPSSVMWWSPDLKGGAKIRWQGLLWLAMRVCYFQVVVLVLIVTQSNMNSAVGVQCYTGPAVAGEAVGPNHSTFGFEYYICIWIVCHYMWLTGNNGGMT